MSHTLINTGAGWSCIKCKRAWDQGESEPEDCSPDDYPFNTVDADWMEGVPLARKFTATDRLIAPHPLPENDGSFRVQITLLADMDYARLAKDHESLVKKLHAANERGRLTDMKEAVGLAEVANEYEKERVRRKMPLFPHQREQTSPPTREKPDPMAVQHGGSHYKSLAIQPTEFCMKNGLDFCIGSILKYVTRRRSKNGVEDLRKARHFVEIREAFPWHIREPGRIEITMLEYVTRNGIRPDDADALYRLEAYYNSANQPDARHIRTGARRLIGEIDSLIAQYG